VEKSIYGCSTTESVEGSALSLESVDNVHSSDGFSTSVLSVGDGISDNVLEERLEDLSGVVVDERGDSLNTTSSCESSDCGFSDSLNRSLVGSLCVSLGTNFAHSFTAFTACHFC